MKNPIRKDAQRCSAAIGQSHLLAALSRQQIRYSETLITQSLLLLRGQRIYPYDQVPQTQPAGQAAALAECRQDES